MSPRHATFENRVEETGRRLVGAEARAHSAVAYRGARDSSRREFDQIRLTASQWELFLSVAHELSFVCDELATLPRQHQQNLLDAIVLAGARAGKPLWRMPFGSLTALCRELRTRGANV